MSLNTKIEWCDSTVNPVMGCGGCELWSKDQRKCYAGILHQRFGGATKGYAPSFEQVTKFPGRMSEAARAKDLSGMKRSEKPWLNGLPRIYFISDMGDALSSQIDFQYLENEIISNVCSTGGQRHVWLWLTKRPERMAAFSIHLSQKGVSWPLNLCPGTSITGQSTISRIASLEQVGGIESQRFLSIEPQLEPLKVIDRLKSISWVIHGGESGNGARPFDLDWARQLKDTCSDAGVPYFLKQLGSNPILAGRPVDLISGHGNDWNEWPADLRVRETPFEAELDIFERLEIPGRASDASCISE